MSNTPKPEVRKFNVELVSDRELAQRIYNYLWCTRPTYFLDIALTFEVTVDFVIDVLKFLDTKVFATDRAAFRFPVKLLATERYHPGIREDIETMKREINSVSGSND